MRCERKTFWGWADYYGLVEFDLVVEEGQSLYPQDPPVPEGKTRIRGLISFLEEPRMNCTGPLLKGRNVRPFSIRIYDKIILGRIVDLGEEIGSLHGVYLNEDRPGLVSLDPFQEHERVGFSFTAMAYMPPKEETN